VYELGFIVSLSTNSQTKYPNSSTKHSIYIFVFLIILRVTKSKLNTTLKTKKGGNVVIIVNFSKDFHITWKIYEGRK